MRFEEILKSLAEAIENRNLENSNVAQNSDEIIQSISAEETVDQK